MAMEGPGPFMKVPCSVFLPVEMVLSQQAINYQLAHAVDFNCTGLNTFTILLMVVVTTAVALRLWSRKVARIEFKADDYTLVLGWVRVPLPSTRLSAG